MLIAAAGVMAGCATTEGPQAYEDSLDNYIRSTVASQPTWEHADTMMVLLRRIERQGNQGVGLMVPAEPADQFIDAALSHLGTRYQWGGTSPDTGFDCSGLVRFVARESLGLELPRRAREQAALGQQVGKQDLQPGDLVFFNTLGQRYSHVGIYLGENRFVHSPNSRGVVRVEDMTVAYWQKRYNGARRLNGLTTLASNN